MATELPQAQHPDSLSHLKEIEKAVDLLRARNLQLERSVSRLEQINNDLMNKADTLEAANTDLRERLVEKTMGDDEANDLRAGIDHTIQKLEAENAELDAENDLIAEERDKLKGRVVELESECEQLQRQMDELLAIQHREPPFANQDVMTAIGSLRAKLGL